MLSENDKEMETKECFGIDEAARCYYADDSNENLELLVCTCSRLIYHFVRLYGLQQFYEDLYQAGYEGLLKALKRFDPEKGASFTTYAGSLIIGEIRHYIRKEAAYYRPSVVMKLQESVSELIEDQMYSTGEMPSCNRIAETLNLKEEGIFEVMKTGLVPLEQVDMSKIASYKLESFKLPIEDRIMLEQALEKLSGLQRKVIDMLFYSDLTQDQTARKLDINQRKVSRELHKGLDSLKRMMA